MKTSSNTLGRKLAFTLAVLAGLIAFGAVISNYARGREFDPRPLGAIVIAMIVFTSLRSKRQ